MPEEKKAQAVPKSWRSEEYSFEFRGKKFTAKIDGHLVLNDMGLQEIKDRLNDLPGKFAYWKTLQVTVERQVEIMKEEMVLWNAVKYEKASQSFDKKPTETAIKNKVILDNMEEYREKYTAIKDLEHIAGQISAIVKAYDIQAWTLRSIAGLTSQELGSIEVHGRGNLGDMGPKRGRTGGR